MEDKISELRNISRGHMNNEILENFGIKYEFNSSLQDLMGLHFQLELLKQGKEHIDDIQIQQYIGLMGVIYGDIIQNYIGIGEYIDDENKGMILKIKNVECDIYNDLYNIISTEDINIYSSISKLLNELQEDKKIVEIDDYQFVHLRAYSTYMMMRETYNVLMDFSSNSLEGIFEYSMLLHKEFEEIPEESLNNLIEMLSGYVACVFLMSFDSSKLQFGENGEGIIIVIGNSYYYISNKIYKNISEGESDDIRGLFTLAYEDVK